MQTKAATFPPQAGDCGLFNALNVLEGRLSTPSAATSFKLVEPKPRFLSRTKGWKQQHPNF